MTYPYAGATDVEGDRQRVIPPVEGAVIPTAFWTFDMVEDRLVEALLTCWRYPDRERGWQTLRSAWPEITRDRMVGDYDARGGDGVSATLRPASQTRAEVTEMEEAFGWLDLIEPDVRKLVGLAIRDLASGKREVRWSRLMRDMGITRGSDGLRMRYGRAITSICTVLNGGNPRGRRVNPDNSRG